MKFIKTKNAPQAIGAYSQAVDANGTLYISGQIPFDPETMKCVEGGAEAQTKQSLQNIKAILDAAGYTKNDIVKVSIFIKDMGSFSQINSVYANFFQDHKPARACVEVARLPRDVLVEIEAIAVK